MFSCYCDASSNTTPLIPLTSTQLDVWLAQQPKRVCHWVRARAFCAKAGELCWLPDKEGKLSGVLVGLADDNDFLSLGACPSKLASGDYHLDMVPHHPLLDKMLLAFGMGSYQFSRYKKTQAFKARLVIPSFVDKAHLLALLTVMNDIRDLINTPAEDLTPGAFIDHAKALAQPFHARIKQTVGEALLEHYPLVHAVGRASAHAPRLLDLSWGDPKHPKLTLVAKGVCYDTGGLSLKTTAGMLNMKKDMGGGAHALGLAQLVMQAQLPVRLRLLIPLVENALSGHSMRPGDVFTAANGLSVEVTNTDAEGRLILADALANASLEAPDLLIDLATLTGAARVALGPDIAVLMTNQVKLAQEIQPIADKEQDPIWPLPLYTPYRRYLDSEVANISNASQSGVAGTILAGLFLESFVGHHPWMHFDIYAWQDEAMPGRPKGGAVCALRALFAYLKQRYT